MFSDLSELSLQEGIPYLPPDSHKPFAEYITDCRTLITERRLDLTGTPSQNAKIIDANSPYELQPTATHNTTVGAILTHGLWDSPFSLQETAQALQAYGILCRSILLPGHGTRPSDLKKISYQDWIQAVGYGIDSLKKEVEHIFLVGYSAGAALSVYHALHEKISGIILLAPAIAIKPIMDFVFQWHNVMQWVGKNNEWIYLEKEIDYTKYRSIAFQPALQIFQLTKLLLSLTRKQTVTCPIFMSISQDDETISAPSAINFFLNSSHPLSQLLLYTNQKKTYSDPRIITRHTSYQALSIENFSHVSLPFSENNKHYGVNGDYPRASHLNDKFIYGAYNRVNERFYNPFYQLGLMKKCRRELTYNPDFNFMADSIIKFVARIINQSSS